MAKNQIVLTQQLIQEYENQYLELLDRETLGTSDCARISAYRSGILLGVQSGLKSNLFPEILTNPADECTAESPYCQYIIGNAWYTIKRFDEAIDSYTKIDSSGTDPIIVLFAGLNLSAAYSANGQNEMAISTLKKMLDAKRNEMDELDPLNNEFINHIRINLAALYMNEGAIDAAEYALNAVDSTSLSPYWAIIWNCNRLTCYQLSYQFERSNWIWQAYLKDESLANLPEGVHEACIEEALKSSDLKYLLDQRQELRINGNSPLLSEESVYHALLSTEIENDSLASIWQQHKKWEQDFESFVLSKKLNFDENQAKLSALESQLEAELAEQSAQLNVRNRLIAMLVALGLVLIGWRIFRLHTKRKQLDSMMKKGRQDQVPVASGASQLNLDDVRLIGEAIAYGRKTSDAMLILKRVNLSLQSDLDAREKVDLSNVKAYKVLNHTELQVAQYILSGFHAKDIARLLKCSASHIYNTRSKIRIKLNIPEGESIENFLIKEIG